MSLNLVGVLLYLSRNIALTLARLHRLGVFGSPVSLIILVHIKPAPLLALPAGMAKAKPQWRADFPHAFGGWMGLHGHTEQDNVEKPTFADVCREKLMGLSSSCYLRLIK